MNFQGQLLLAGAVIVRRLEGELKPKMVENGTMLYRGHFTTPESPDLNLDNIYLLQTTAGPKTKVKVRGLLSDIDGIKIYSIYATHPLK